MKKIISSILVCFITICAFIPIEIKADENKSSQDFLDEFDSLQDDIDKVITIKDEKYVYNERNVIQVIENANFDFDGFNKKTGLNYTEEGFIKEVLYQLSTTEPKIVYSESSCSINTKGTYCGRNAVAEGWNYYRKFTDKTKSEADTKKWLKLYEDNMDKYQFDSIRNIQDVLPDWGRIIVGISSIAPAIETVYALNMCGALRRYNKGKCGTVIDTNKFTTSISGWSQDTFTL